MAKYSQPQGENPYHILLVYGYHPNEKFAKSTVRKLARDYDLPSTKVVEFPPDADYGPKDDVRDLAMRRFARQYLPFDYLVDVHDSPRAKDRGTITFPSCGFIYVSKYEISKDLIKDLKRYTERKNLEFPDRFVERRFNAEWYLASPKYDYLEVELMPRYIRTDQGIEYLRGLLQVLSNHPNRL